MRKIQTILLILVASILGACATSNSGDVYRREDTRKIQSVRMGVIESVRTVKLEGTNSNIGTAAGAAVVVSVRCAGNLAGQQMFHVSGQDCRSWAVQRVAELSRVDADGRSPELFSLCLPGSQR